MVLSRPLVLILCAASFLMGCNKNASWTEQVLLADGRVISISRHEVIGRDGFFRPGRGSTKSLILRIPTQEGEVSTPAKYPGTNLVITHAPEILDFLGGDPVMVKQIGGKLCKAYGYPPEGMIAFRYRDKSWKRIPVADLPANFAANVSESAGYALASSRYQGDINLQKKRAFLPRNNSEPLRIREIVLKNSHVDGACATQAEMASTAYQDERRILVNALAGIDTEPLNSPQSMPVDSAHPIGSLAERGMQQKDGGLLISPTCEKMIDDVKSYPITFGRNQGGAPGVRLRIQLAGSGHRSIDIPHCEKRCGFMNHALTCDASIALTSVIPRAEPTTNNSLSVITFDQNGRALKKWYAALPRTVGKQGVQEDFVVSSAKHVDGVLNVIVAHRTKPAGTRVMIEDTTYAFTVSP
jgi:hypothetical protein